MADDPILLGLSGATFLMTNEPGGMIQSFQRRTTRKKILVYDASVGKTTGKVYHDPMATYDVRIITTAGTGLAAAAPGIAVTLANTTSGNGVSTGGVYVDDTTLSHNAESLQEFSFTAEQSPAIS